MCGCKKVRYALSSHAKITDLHDALSCPQPTRSLREYGAHRARRRTPACGRGLCSSAPRCFGSRRRRAGGPPTASPASPTGASGSVAVNQGFSTCPPVASIGKLRTCFSLCQNQSAYCPQLMNLGGLVVRRRSPQQTQASRCAREAPLHRNASCNGPFLTDFQNPITGTSLGSENDVNSILDTYAICVRATVTWCALIMFGPPPAQRNPLCALSTAHSLPPAAGRAFGLHGQRLHRRCKLPFLCQLHHEPGADKTHTCNSHACEISTAAAARAARSQRPADASCGCTPRRVTPDSRGCRLMLPRIRAVELQIWRQRHVLLCHYCTCVSFVLFGKGSDCLLIWSLSCDTEMLISDVR